MPLTSDSPRSITASKTLSVALSGGNVSGNWVIQALQYLSPLPIEAIYPRPDTETSANALHRKAHTGVTYRIPVGVRAGCWPYKYEIISGPAGATIGSEMTRTIDSATGMILHEPGNEYGYITWNAPTDGESFSFLVRVTDQLGAAVDLAWDGVVDNASFVFVDSVSGNDANAGTQAAPLETFANGLWKNDDADSTYGGKIAVMSGVMDVNSGTLPSSPILNTSVKPIAFIGDATLNCSQGHFRTSGALTDFAISGMSVDGSRSDLSNNRLFNLTDRAQRFVAFECLSDNVTAGTVENDNPGIFCFMGVGSSKHEHTFITGCEAGPACASQLVVTFDTDHLLIERNSGDNLNITASNGGNFIHVKDDSSHATVRANSVSGFILTSGIGLPNQNTLAPRITDQEICYNTVVFSSSSNVAGAISWNGQAGAGALNTHDYRNSVVSTSRAYRVLSGYEGDVPVSFMASVISQETITGAQPAINGEAPPSVELTSSDFDAVGSLIGSARTAYLGTQGAEIAGDS